LINNASGLGQRIRSNPTLAQLDSFAERPEMINKMRADVFAAEQPEGPAGH
jgi:hypothetical protein